MLLSGEVWSVCVYVCVCVRQVLLSGEVWRVPVLGWCVAVLGGGDL